MLVSNRTLAADTRHPFGSRATVRSEALRFSGSLSSEDCSPLRCGASSQRAAAALLRQHSCVADMLSSVACHGHEMADNKKNMTPE